MSDPLAQLRRDVVDGVEVIVERESVTIRTLGSREIDPEWAFTDAAGHEHDASLASLRWVVTETWWCEECRDEHEVGEYRCVLCDEKITPRTRHVHDEPFSRPGRESTYAVIGGNQYHLTPEQVAAYQESGATDEWLASLLSDGARL